MKSHLKNCTNTDAWGQTRQVDPPLGPGVDYAYDAAGQLTGVTYGAAQSTFEYNYAGMKTSMSDADMGVWSYTYNARGGLKEQIDARSCATHLGYDVLGRLLRKSYAAGCPATTSVTYEFDGISYTQPFNGPGLPAGWAGSGNATVTGGVLQVVGDNSWNQSAYRASAGSDGKVIRFAFKTSDVQSWSALFVDSGSGAAYRRWGLSVGGGMLYREYYEGTAGSGKALLAVSPNTWYEVALALNGASGFRVFVWQRGNPAASGWDSVQFATGWSGLAWRFAAHPYAGTLQLDDYQEQSQAAIGQRTGMTDASGSTAWGYTFDVGGRVVQETRTVTGQGTFLTQTGSNNVGLPGWMCYPGGNAGQVGEKLTYSYLPQGALNGITSSLGNYLLISTAYDAAGRVTLRKLGGTYGLQNAFAYFDWGTPNGAGRLKRITAGLYSDTDSLLDLRYFSGTNTPAYNAVGNLLNIYDYVVGYPQTQTFAYDTLDRLVNAQASGGRGGSYGLESYSYDPNSGSLSGKTGMGSYTYLDSTHTHAVTHLNGVQKYWYDQNGNQVKRILGSDTYDLAYDAENRLVEVKKNNTVMATFTYNGDGQRVKQTLNSVTTTFIGEYYQQTGSSVTKYRCNGKSRGERETGKK